MATLNFLTLWLIAIVVGLVAIWLGKRGAAKCTWTREQANKYLLWSVIGAIVSLYFHLPVLWLLFYVFLYAAVKAFYRDKALRNPL